MFVKSHNLLRIVPNTYLGHCVALFMLLMSVFPHSSGLNKGMHHPYYFSFNKVCTCDRLICPMYQSSFTVCQCAVLSENVPSNTSLEQNVNISHNVIDFNNRLKNKTAFIRVITLKFKYRGL